MKPVIEFKGYEIENIYYNKNELSEELKKELTFDEIGNAMKLAYKTGLSSDEKMGLVSFMINIYRGSDYLNFELEVSGHFAILDKLNPEKIDEYLSINGTAILFPYVRSIVSMLTTLDSKDAIILPTINTSIFGEVELDSDFKN